jgi:hypothetical protein
MEWAKEIIARERAETGAPVQPAPVSSRRITLNDRKEEFWQAAMRSIDQNFVVYEDWDFGSFVVVNKTNQTEYRVELEAIGDRSYVSCNCKDYSFRKHICKHIVQVLQARMFGLVQAA